MKKLAALMCGILCVCLLSVPVFAQSGSDPAIIITDGDGESGAIVVGVSGQEPVSVTTKTVEGVPYITKMYELPRGTDASAFTASFEQDGFLFTKYDVTQQVQQGQRDTKTATEIDMLESESGKVADIVAAAAPVLLYNEGGYTGQLALDVAAIVVEENGSSSYSYRVEDVREYTSLDRNDAAYVPKTVLKNGITLQLENIEWVVMGQHPVDGRMVPSLFKAIATYAGTATRSRATGYTATLTYTGDVTKATPGTVVYTITFRGEPVVSSAPDASEPAADGDIKGRSLLSWIAIVVLSAACLALGIYNGVRIIQRIRRRREEQDEDYSADDLAGYEGYTEGDPGLLEPVVSGDTQLFSQEPQQAPQEPPLPFQS